MIQLFDVVMINCSEAQGESTDQKQKLNLTTGRVTRGNSNSSWFGARCSDFMIW